MEGRDPSLFLCLLPSFSPYLNPFREADFGMIKAKAVAFLSKLESPGKFPQTTPEA